MCLLNPAELHACVIPPLSSLPGLLPRTYHCKDLHPTVIAQGECNDRHLLTNALYMYVKGGRMEGG
jgi:hypothetical protein